MQQKTIGVKGLTNTRLLIYIVLSINNEKIVPKDAVLIAVLIYCHIYPYTHTHTHAHTHTYISIYINTYLHNIYKKVETLYTDSNLV